MEDKKTVKVRKVKYNTFELNVDVDLSIDEIREELAEIFPEIENADYTQDEEGTITFTMRAGEKGV